MLNFRVGDKLVLGLTTRSFPFPLIVNFWNVLLTFGAWITAESTVSGPVAPSTPHPLLLHLEAHAFPACVIKSSCAVSTCKTALCVTAVSMSALK